MKYCYHLEELIIPESVKYMTYASLLTFENLTNLTISNHFKLRGDRFFFVNENTLFSIACPCDLNILNGNYCQQSLLKSFTIPSNVTKLGNHCFTGCDYLKDIHGFDRIKEIGRGCFNECASLDLTRYPKLLEKGDQFCEYGF